jgi:hypothetical protein
MMTISLRLAGVVAGVVFAPRARRSATVISTTIVSVARASPPPLAVRGRHEHAA